MILITTWYLGHGFYFGSTYFGSNQRITAWYNSLVPIIVVSSAIEVFLIYFN